MTTHLNSLRGLFVRGRKVIPHKTKRKWKPKFKGQESYNLYGPERRELFFPGADPASGILDRTNRCPLSSICSLLHSTQL